MNLVASLVVYGLLPPPKWDSAPYSHRPAEWAALYLQQPAPLPEGHPRGWSELSENSYQGWIREARREMATQRIQATMAGTRLYANRIWNPIERRYEPIRTPSRGSLP